MYSKTLIVYLFVAVLALESGCQQNAVSPQERNSASWNLCEGLPNNLRITTFASSANNLVAGTFDKDRAYIFISFDDGATWSLDTAFHVYNKLPFNHLYLGTPVTFLSYAGYLIAGIGGAYRGAIYRSTDDGLTWSDNGITWPENDSDFSEDVNCFAATGPDIFAGTDHAVFVSTDMGSSWQGVNNGFPIDASSGRRPQALHMTVEGTILFAGGSSGRGIYHSTDDGVSWTPVNDGLTNTSMSIYGLATLG